MKNVNKSAHLTAIKAAFPHTLPIMAGFLFLGASYGVLMTSRGFSFLYPMLTSILVFAGSMEFALANLLLGAFNPAQAVFMTLMINARHIFYGISMLDKYRGMGLKKIYMIFALCDETFSINCSVQVPDDVDRGLFMTYTSLLDHFYWISGATIGGIFGALLPLGIKGIDFAMTAMFVAILLEQLLRGARAVPSVIIGVVLSALSLLIFGSSDFLIPAMLMILVALAVFRRPIDRLNPDVGGDVK